MKNVLIGLSFVFVLQTSADAQILKRLQQKVSDAAEKVIDKKIEQKTDQLIGGNENNSGIEVNNNNGEGVSGQASQGGSGRNRINNTEGAGLVTTPPDVRESLSSAESAFRSENYGAARYAIQQAIMGVEMEIGDKLLKSLPDEVSGLAKEADQDRVTSTGWGWAGLHIYRSYMGNNKQLIFNIANNSVLSAANQFLINGAYTQSTGGQQNWKQIMIKGNRAVIEYDESSGYKISVPLGQTSLLAFEGINFSGEQDMMNAVNQFDVEGIKRTLGEK
jgi:hypothetical protein